MIKTYNETVTQYLTETGVTDVNHLPKEYKEWLEKLFPNEYRYSEEAAKIFYKAKEIKRINEGNERQEQKRQEDKKFKRETEINNAISKARSVREKINDDLREIYNKYKGELCRSSELNYCMNESVNEKIIMTIIKNFAVGEFNDNFKDIISSTYNNYEFINKYLVI
jgi:flagellar biosynthesis GTPase FlhF